MAVSVHAFLVLILISSSAAFQNMTRSYDDFYCVSDNQCRELLGVKSLCIANACQCVPHYHINNNRICIKDRGLREQCESSDECYWGPEMVDRIECSLGVCSCKHGYVPADGRICINYFTDAAVKNSLSCVTVTIFGILLYFIK